MGFIYNIEKLGNYRNSTVQLQEMGDFKKINGYSRIWTLKGYTPKGYLCKYLPFSRFANSVKDGEIYLSFCSPKCWTDPFEHIYWKLDYGILNFQIPDIACFCMTEDKATSKSAAAMWKEYRSGDDKIVRLAFNPKILLDCLDEYANAHNCRFYISQMNYGYSREDLENGAPLRDLKSQFIDDGFDIGTYLKLMSLKRRVFCFENEIRIFLVGEKLDKDIIPVCISCPPALIPRITIGPLQPFSYNDPRQEVYDELSSKCNSQYEKRIRELIPAAIVNFASIYKLSKSNSVASVQKKLNDVLSSL